MLSAQFQPQRDGFAELERLVETLPEEQRDAFRSAVERAERKTQFLTDALQYCRREIAQLRLDATYLRFDAEASLRERDSFARKLDR